MKLWINFEEKDIKERKNGWIEGDDFEDQLIFKKKQDLTNCMLKIKDDIVELHFDNGWFTMTIKEFGGLFQ